MRASQEEKTRSHRRIVEGAARLMRERGVDDVSVADAMADAGLTIGGFYKHFDSKNALVAEAIGSAFDTVPVRVNENLAVQDPTRALADYRALYLSMDHVRSPGIGCPVAVLGGDVGRGPASLKKAFGAGVSGIVGRIAGCLTGSASRRRERAAREFAMMVGAVVIARASDPATAREILAACGGTLGSEQSVRSESDVDE